MSINRHTPSHLRDSFLVAVEAFLDWQSGDPEPLIEYDKIDSVPKPATVSEMCKLVWNCTDIIPGLYYDHLRAADLVIGKQTYAACARAIFAHLRDDERQLFG